MSMAAALLLATVLPTSVNASPTPVDRTYTATAADLFQLAENMTTHGVAEQAEPILALLAQNPDANVRNEARYRQALLLETQGRDRDAAVLLRRILDDKPGAAAVRLKLATTLQKLGDEQAALRELRAVGTSNLPPTVARFVDRLSASLQASKPFGIQVEFALAPDSNANRATRSDTLGTVFGDFTLDEDARAKSGLGAALRGMGHARLRLSDGFNLAARAGFESNIYRDKDFNDISLDLSAGPEFRLGRTRFTAEAGLVEQWYGMEPYQRTLRVAASAVRPIDAASQVRLDAGVRWMNNKLNDLQDGHGLSPRVRYERALSPRLLVSTSLGFDRFKARDPAYSTRTWAAGIAAYREMGRMTLSVGAEYARLKADERLQLLPEARSERLMRFHVGSVYRQLTFGGFAPMTRLVIERNRSTVEYYDYKRVRTEVGISRAF